MADFPVNRINVWSSPRNISTAFMYAFAQRPDTVVHDEPLYAHYLTHTDTEAVHPDTPAILQSQPTDGNLVIRDLLLGPSQLPVAVFKQMTHHLVAIDWSFMQQMQNVLLIRDPRAIIASYARVIPNPSIQDVGVALQKELFTYLRQHNCLNAIIDARQLLRNPADVLQQLCEHLGLSFTPAMLQWAPGPKPYDGVWAPHWYANVHASTGFQPYADQYIALPEYLEPLAETCRPYYEELLPYSLQAST